LTFPEINFSRFVYRKKHHQQYLKGISVRIRYMETQTAVRFAVEGLPDCSYLCYCPQILYSNYSLLVYLDQPRIQLLFLEIQSWLDNTKHTHGLS
jgi:hypothetical protein